MRTITECLKASPLELFNGADITDGKNYAYFGGKGKILLQAHVDTIFPCKNLKVMNNIISGNGLGADDRAGVYACMLLREKYPDTPVLLTNGEETGGTGMSIATVELWPEEFQFVNLAIAIDRQGSGGYVTYNHLPKKAKKYVESFGFHEQVGSFSDIQIFTDYYEIPSVNVCCGYYNQHTLKERLVLDELCLTISRLETILRNPIQKRHKPEKIDKWAKYDWEYANYEYSKSRYGGICKSKTQNCIFCNSNNIQDYGQMTYCNYCGEVWDAIDTYTRPTREVPYFGGIL